MALGLVMAAVGIVGTLTDAGTGGGEPRAEPSAADTAPAAGTPSRTAGASTPTATPVTPAPTAKAVATPAPLLAVRALFADVEQAAAGDDIDGLLALVHPVVLEVYGEGQCREFLTSFAAARPSFTVTEAGGPEPYDFDRDGLAVPVGDALTAQLVITVDGQSLDRQEIHAATADGRLRFFTDCGDPL